MTDPACYFHRDGMGFCLLENHCWAGKPCPKSQEEADEAHAKVVEEAIVRRDLAAPAEGAGIFDSDARCTKTTLDSAIQDFADAVLEEAAKAVEVENLVEFTGSADDISYDQAISCACAVILDLKSRP